MRSIISVGRRESAPVAWRTTNTRFPRTLSRESILSSPTPVVDAALSLTLILPRSAFSHTTIGGPLLG